MGAGRVEQIAMAYVLAVAAALANALTSILQRMGVETAPPATSLHLSLIAYAVRRKIWIAGFVLMIGAFVLQFLALHFGRLSTVQPILTLELPFLVVILGVWFRQPLGWKEWLGSSAAAGGLAAFLALSSPTGGNETPDLDELTTRGWSHVFLSWPPYAMAAMGIVGMFLAQNAYQAGPVTASQSALVIVDPLASIAIGVGLFGDHVQAGGGRLAWEVLAMLVLLAGVFSLARSPLVVHVRTEGAAADDPHLLGERSRGLLLRRGRDDEPGVEEPTGTVLESG